MSLCGAWALNGGEIGTLLTEADRRAMAGRLSDPTGELAEFSRGPLWLACSKELLVSEGENCLAAEGFLAHGARALFEAARGLGPEEVLPPWDGHYSLAYARVREGRLLLRRDPGGGERLFYHRTKDLLLFASSIRPLSALESIPRKLDNLVAKEQLLNKSIVFGKATLWDGIDEVPPGRDLVVSGGDIRLLPIRTSLPSQEGGDPDRFPLLLRETLSRAVRGAIGKDSRAAVALSGGIDSATIAVLAAEALGPENIHAFTYEFDDPSHASETERAAAFAKRMGLRHTVLRIRLEDHLDSLPEALWRMEHPFDLKHGPQAMLLSRFIRREGFPSFLTGNGLEQCLGVFSHDRYLEDLSRAAAWLPAPGVSLGHWRAKAFHEQPRPPLSLLLGALPAIPPAPPIEVYYLALCALRHGGALDSIADFYPEDLRPWAGSLCESPRVREALSELSAVPLSARFRRLLFDSFSTRCSIRPIQKAGREAGATPVSPAFFESSLALCGEAYAITRGDVPAARALQRRVMEGVFGPDAEFSPKPPLIELSQTGTLGRTIGNYLDNLNARIGGPSRHG
ncbi:MAG: asparagine synthase-related protein, partial [Elusimicrobiota bacterium]